MKTPSLGEEESCEDRRIKTPTHSPTVDHKNYEVNQILKILIIRYFKFT